MGRTFLNVGVVGLFLTALFVAGCIGAALLSYATGRWSRPGARAERSFSALDRIERAGRRRRGRGAERVEGYQASGECPDVGGGWRKGGGAGSEFVFWDGSQPADDLTEGTA